MNIYQSNTYTKDLDWLHLDNEPRVQERQQVRDQQIYISFFVTRNTSPDRTAVCHPWLHGRFIEIQRTLRRNLEAVFAIDVM